MLCSLIERWLIYGSDEKLDTDSRYGAFSSVAWLTGDQVVFFLNIIYLLFVRCKLAKIIVMCQKLRRVHFHVIKTSMTSLTEAVLKSATNLRFREEK